MKKFLSIFILAIAAVVIAVSFSSCASGNNNSSLTGTDTAGETTSEITAGETTSAETTAPEKTKVNITALIGPTGMGLVKLMEDNAAGTASNDYNFTLSSAPDNVTAELISGSTDLAALPLNLASVLYNKTEGKVQLAAVNTLGVLYMLEKGDTITSVADLRGKTIYATGQGSTPEYILRYVLSQNGIDPDKDVTIEFKAEHAELAAAMTSNDVAIGMLPEPNVTAVLSGNTDVRVALDMNAEWQKLTGAPVIQGCVVVRTEFAKAHPEAVAAFLDEYKTSVDYVNANIPDAAKLIEKNGVLPKAAIAEKALPRCNIVYRSAADSKTDVAAFLDILNSFNPKAIGGKLPGDDFYYSK